MAMRVEDGKLLSLQMEMAAIRLHCHAARSHWLVAKGVDLASDRARFAARLTSEAEANSRMLLAALRALDLSEGDLPEISAARNDVLAEWKQRALRIADVWDGEPERRAAALDLLEEQLTRRFAGRINAERQHALGIDRYVWRSRDDRLVRPLHAAHDDQVFFWDEPPEGGHPGEAPNCRCIAEPVLVDEADWRPIIDGSYGRAVDLAILEGAFDAAVDFVAEFVPSVGDLRALLDALAWLVDVGGEAAELAYLLVRDQLVGLAESERTRRDALVGDAGSWAKGLASALADAPALARGLLDYVRAIEARPSALDQAYRRGYATRADVEDAYRERSYLRASAALYGLTTVLSARTAAKGLTARLLGRFGRSADLGDNATGWTFANLAGRARALSPDADWQRIDNPGIVWGKGIKDQGGPWERHLAERGDLGDWIEQQAPNFKTFDFFDKVKGAATSAKTLDTRALGYVHQPRRVFITLRSYIDRAHTFDGHIVKEYTIKVSEIERRRLAVAIPFGTTAMQIAEINRARAYAERFGVEMEVMFVR
ncbi:SPP1 gp7 family putative phage head morphogenesis protein [Amorphus suaedae]